MKLKLNEFAANILRSKVFTVVGAGALAALAGCGDGSGGAAGRGSLQLFIVPEGSVTEGLTPGTGGENVVDGWTVTYETFVVAFGNFRATRSAAPDDQLSAPAVTLVDLTHVPTNGLVVADFSDVSAARWDRVGFDLPNATGSAAAAEGLAPEDRERMVSQGYSLIVRGRIDKPTGQSCNPKDATVCVPTKTIAFEFALAAGTSFDDCAPSEGDAGFSVPAGGSVQVKPTIHGDHWFFNNVTQGAELTERRAQWLADCDLDNDGRVDLAELAKTKASDVFRAPTYNVSGGMVPLEFVADWVELQARTIGDFQGDGECPTRKAIP